MGDINKMAAAMGRSGGRSKQGASTTIRKQATRIKQLERRIENLKQQVAALTK